MKGGHGWAGRGGQLHNTEDTRAKLLLLEEWKWPSCLIIAQSTDLQFGIHTQAFQTSGQAMGPVKYLQPTTIRFKAKSQHHGHNTA